MRIPKPEPRGYPGNLGLLFAEHAAWNRTAITDLHNPVRPRPVTFCELDQACNACARGLRRAGLQPGDRVGVLSINRIEFVIALLGAMRAGVVPVPINVKLSADTISYILRDSGACLIFAERDAKARVPGGTRVVEFDDFESFLDPGSLQAFEPNPDSGAYTRHNRSRHHSGCRAALPQERAECDEARIDGGRGFAAVASVFG